MSLHYQLWKSSSDKNLGKKANRLVNDDVNVNISDTRNQRAPLHQACIGGDSRAVRVLMSNGADVDCKDTYGNTPLHYAIAHHGHTEIVLFLVSNGANVSCKTNCGWTPLHFASCGGHIESAFVLLDHGADLSIKNNNGKTALDVAKDKDVATQLTRKASTCPSSIQDKLKLVIKENERLKSVIVQLHDNLKSTTATLSEQHKMEISAIDNRLNWLIQENERLKSTKSLTDEIDTPDTAELARIVAEQAKHEMMLNLLTKRKELQDAGLAAWEIDEHLPLPPRKENEELKKKRRVRFVEGTTSVKL
jgi:hypothetical protein